jgi:hypothetical protein
MTVVHWWRVVLVLTVVVSGLEAQETAVRDSSALRVDTLTIAARSAVLADDTLRPPHSPLLAMGLSALLPGGGQFYNKSYWKIPVVLGLGGYFVYEFIDNHRQYKEYRDQYQAGLAALPSGDRRILALREFYKDQRDSFGWYFLILYAANIADAYVDASLFGFDVGGNLGRGAPRDGPALPGTSVTIRFPLP